MSAMRVLLVLPLLVMGGVAATAAVGPPDGSTPEQQTAIAGDPPFVARTLTLTNVPRGTRPARSLFNGRDLSGWDSWLGYDDPARTYAPNPGAPIGLNHDSTGVFSVVMQDGAPALLANGRIFGALVTKKAYANYHLHVEFKWGEHQWTPMPRNNGILYHSHGAYGAFFGTWMQAVEFEIVPGSVGMLLGVGDSRRAHGFEDVAWNVGARVAAGHDPAIAYPHRRFMVGGTLAAVKFPAYNVDAATNAEKPLGQWNALDLYVVGNRSVHVVNGVPVLVAQDLSSADGHGTRPRPLTSGRIQLQSEGAETYFRNISIEPIDHLPTVSGP